MSEGPRDKGTNGPKDKWWIEGTKGPMDHGFKRPRDQRTEGPIDQGTKGPMDQGYERSSDQGTKEPREQGTKGCVDPFVFPYDRILAHKYKEPRYN